jgi:hypothetical protein
MGRISSQPCRKTRPELWVGSCIGRYISLVKKGTGHGTIYIGTLGEAGRNYIPRNSRGGGHELYRNSRGRNYLGTLGAETIQEF